MRDRKSECKIVDLSNTVSKKVVCYKCLGVYEHPKDLETIWNSDHFIFVHKCPKCGCQGWYFDTKR